jgi:hypothetical protein
MIALLPPPPLERTVSYLKSEGWDLVSNNDRWYVFEGYEDIDGETFEIILSKNVSSPDFRLYIQQTLDILASLTDKTPEIIVGEIIRFERDIFNSHISKYVDLCSTTLRSAHDFVAGIKQLFVCGTVSEVRDSKPYYQNVGSNPGRVLDEVRFGHTFPSSFGFSVESPVKTQTDMFEAPLQRRVMERIVRGLATTEEASKMEDVVPLLKGYETGFSANMCDAILSMTHDHHMEIEYSIKWSNKYPAAEDLRTISSVCIKQIHFELLKSASEQLKRIEPEFVTVEGHIVSLRSPDDPQSEEDVERKVTVEWNYEEGKSRRVVVPVESHEYLEAFSAQWNNRPISVQGYIRGRERLLEDPRDFKVLSEAAEHEFTHPPQS